MKKIIFTQEQKQYIIDSYTGHKKSSGELAKEFGCSIDVISRRLKEWGVSLSRGGHFPYKDLTGLIFGELTVLHVNEERYKKDLQHTNKPHRYWTCICSCGRITDVEGSHLTNGHTTSCGHIKSKGEQLITKLLQENNINFTSEIYFNDLRGYGNGLLRFDFGILIDNQIKYLIEFNGKQHYQETGGWNTPEEYQSRQINDNKKVEYCNNHNLPLIIIPYTHLNKLSLNDLLLETTIFRKV